MAEGYGTIYRMRPKAGAEPQVAALLDEWERDRKPKVPGAVGGYLFRPDNRPGELIGVAIFRDRQSYVANADDPEQDAWYRRLREHLRLTQSGRTGSSSEGFPREAASNATDISLYQRIPG